MVRGGGVEPPHLSVQAPHACVYAIPPPAQLPPMDSNHDSKIQNLVAYH